MIRRIIAAGSICFSALVPMLPTGNEAQPAGLAQAYASASASASALAVDYGRSKIVVKVKRAGLLRFLGHEHGIIPGAWSAEVEFDEADIAASRVAVEVSVADLIIDSAGARSLAGVDPDGPDEQQLEEIRTRMLSSEQLDAAAFPTIRFEGRRLSLTNGDELRIEGTLTLHGVSRELNIEANLEHGSAGDRAESGEVGYIVRGAFKLRQRDFGIEPVSIGGLVKVADEIEISFQIHVRPARP